mmetsp:Transcript_34603/g.78220  ORF Transcript_34603/g.78220 Transcript_34603/m.78220 type:complete len:276 (-) Transcript_34603:20-847(-)
MASYSMTCNVAAGMPIEKAKSRAVQHKYLTEEEAGRMTESGDNLAAPILWMLLLYEAKLQTKNGGDDMRRDMVETRILDMRAGISGILNAVGSFGQPPVILVSFMSILVALLFIFQGLKSGLVIADTILSDTGTKGIQISVEVLICFIAPVFYQGLFEFVIQISNPYGNDWTDVPAIHMQNLFKDYCTMFITGSGAGEDLGPDVNMEGVLGVVGLENATGLLKGSMRGSRKSAGGIVGNIGSPKPGAALGRFRRKRNPKDGGGGAEGPVEDQGAA